MWLPKLPATTIRTGPRIVSLPLLLGGYAWRLRSVDRFVAGAGLLLAFCALAPTMITVVLAIVAER